MQINYSLLLLIVVCSLVLISAAPCEGECPTFWSNDGYWYDVNNSPSSGQVLTAFNSSLVEWTTPGAVGGDGNNYTIECSVYESGATDTISCSRNGMNNFTYNINDNTGGFSANYFFTSNSSIVSQSNSLNSTSVGGWVNVTNMTLYLPSGFSNVECFLAQSAAAATTGVRMIFNVTNTTARNHLLEYYTSTTAQALAQATSVALTVGATASSGSTIAPARYYGHFVVDTAAVFWIQLATEINGSAVTINRGSYCRAFNATT